MTPRDQHLMPVIRPAPERPARARRRTRTIRALLMGLGAAVLAYATIPWWLPTEFIRRRVSDALRRATGCAVNVADVTAGWRDGVIVRGISIADGQDGTSEHVRIDEVRADLSPIRVALGRGLKRLEIVRATIRADIDADGRLSLARLRPESSDMPPAGEIVLRDACVQIRDARSNERTDVQLGEVGVRLDRASGRAEVRVVGDLIREIRSAGADVKQAVASFGSEAMLSLPTVGRGPGELDGAGRLHWDDVDLTSLPIGMIPGLAAARLEGRCGGEIRASVGPQLDQALALSLRLNDVVFAGRADAGDVRVERATLEAAGRWRPTYDLLELTRLRLSLPGIDVRGRPVDVGGLDAAAVGREPVLVWSLRGEQTVRMAAEGRIAARQLADALHQEWLSSADGGARFDGQLSAGRDRTSWSLRLAADELSIPPTGPVALPRGTPAALAIRGVDDPEAGLAVIEEFTVQVGGTRVRGSGGFPARIAGGVAGAWWQEWIERGWFDVSIECDDAGELRERFAALQTAGSGWRWSGRCRAAAWIGATSQGRVVRLSGELDRESTMIVPGVLEKQPGRALRVELSGRSGGTSGTLSDVRLAASYGDAIIETSGDRESFARVAVQRADDARSDDRGRGTAAYGIDTSLALTLVFKRLEDWMELIPPVRAGLSDRFAREGPIARGDATLRVQANLRHAASAGSIWPEHCRVSAQLDGGGVEVQASPAWSKPAGEPARAGVDYWFDRRRPRAPHRVEARLEVEGGVLGLDGSFGGGAAEIEARCEARDVRRLARHTAGLDELVDLGGVDGAATARVRYGESPAGGQRAISVDLTDLGWSRPGWAKAPGVPCALDARFHLARAEGRSAEPSASAPDESRRLRWDVEHLRLVWGASQIEAERGYVSFDERLEASVMQWVASGQSAVLWGDGADWRAEVEAAASIVADDAVRAVAEGLFGAGRQAELTGRCAAQITLAAEPRSMRMRGRLDAGALGVSMGDGFEKRGGSRAELTWDARLEPAPGDPDRPRAMHVTVRELGLGLESGRLSAAGSAIVGREGVRAADARAEFAWSDMRSAVGAAQAGLRRVGWDLASLSGGLSGEVSGYLDGHGWRLRPSALVAHELRAELRPAGKREPVGISLNGPVVVTEDAVRSDGLSVQCGGTRVEAAGELTALRDGARGTIIVSGESVDAIELRRLLGATETGDPDAWLTKALAYLRRADLRVTAHVARAVFDGFSSDTTFPVDELGVDATLNGGGVNATFGCAANGGWIRGAWKLPLDQPDPFFDLEYEAHDLAAAPNTRPIVEAFFPGLTVRDRLTLIDQSHQRLFAPPGAANHPTGKGEMILRNGTAVGRAAPLWVTRIFPGLNLASFEFSEMVNRFEKLPDGTHNNVMTFYGSYYHLYVDGYSKASGEIRYEVGVDLLARISPDLSRIGQGRVALFIKTGTIRNGVLEDEVVSYLTPPEVMRKILSNNVLTVAYYAVKKQVTGL